MRLYYYEGSDDQLLSTVISHPIHDDEDVDNFTFIVLKAGMGWLHNSNKIMDLVKSNDNTIVFTNDLLLLNYVPYDYLNHTFPITFVLKNGDRALKDIYPNTRDVNDLVKMYQTNLFKLY